MKRKKALLGNSYICRIYMGVGLKQNLLGLVVSLWFLKKDKLFVVQENFGLDNGKFSRYH